MESVSGNPNYSSLNRNQVALEDWTNIQTHLCTVTVRTCMYGKSPHYTNSMTPGHLWWID